MGGQVGGMEGWKLGYSISYKEQQQDQGGTWVPSPSYLIGAPHIGTIITFVTLQGWQNALQEQPVHISQ